MSKHTCNHANTTGRTSRPVLAVAGRTVACFYFGYWFSH